MLDSNFASAVQTGNARRLLRTFGMLSALAVSMGTVGCAQTPIPMAPGSESVRITRVPNDVANCKVVGNLDLEIPSTESARNHAVGLGGDTILDTNPLDITGYATPFRTGVVYRCRVQ